ncbi:MAG: Ig-like domain-containing protein [Clostridia bacterium]|nr:Ig-like domain-containing protein [Clostridia bacterium]
MKIKKRYTAITAVLLTFIFLFSACSKGSAKFNRVDLNKVQLQLKVGETFQLGIRGSGNTALSGVEFIGGDETVATISESGLVTALKEGSSVVMVKSSDGYGVCQIVVWGEIVIPLLSMEITGIPAGNTVSVGESAQLNVSFFPANANDYYSLTWSSDNTGVLTVDESGTIVAVNVGTAIITVSANGTLVSAFAELTVTA